MNRATILAIAALASTSQLAVGQVLPASNARVINVTSDSAPGWLPDEALEAEARQIVDRYFHAASSGDIQTAWGLTTIGFKGVTTFGEYQSQNARSRKNMGRLGRLTVLQVTWTKNPANAPALGIYVAIDIAGQFTGAKRQCGYAVLYKSVEAEPFRVARVESNFIDDASARKIAKDQSQAELDRLWSALSANCPNYRFGAVPQG